MSCAQPGIFHEALDGVAQRSQSGTRGGSITFSGAFMRIDLIVPPSSPLFFPSMACSGFKAVLSKAHDVRIHYLNMEFYAFFAATPLTHEVAAFATNTDFLSKDLAFGQPHSKANVEALCRA